MMQKVSLVAMGAGGDMEGGLGLDGLGSVGAIGGVKGGLWNG